MSHDVCQTLGCAAPLPPTRRARKLLLCPSCRSRHYSAAANARAARTCACGVSISNRATQCRACRRRDFNSDPARRAAASATMKRRWQDPAYHEKQGALIRAYETTPQHHATMLENGRRWGTQNIAAPAGSAQRRKAGRTTSATRLAWCPPDRRDEYRALRKKKGMRAHEARALIEQDIAAAQRRKEVQARNAFGPSFAATLARVAAGAPLVARPILVSSAPTQTLGGVASAML